LALGTLGGTLAEAGLIAWGGGAAAERLATVGALTGGADAVGAGGLAEAWPGARRTVAHLGQRTAPPGGKEAGNRKTVEHEGHFTWVGMANPLDAGSRWRHLPPPRGRIMEYQTA